MRKTRSDAKLLNLPEEQQAKLAEWLLGGVPYHAARELVTREFGVTVALSSFQLFWESVCGPALLARRSRAVGLADVVAAAARRSPGEFDEATLAALKQKAFELASSPGAEAKDVRDLVGLLLKARDQDLKASQTKLAWTQFQFDAAKAALEQAVKLKVIGGDRSLDAAAKVQRARQLLFGELPGGEGTNTETERTPRTPRK